jgi:heptosyltransferase-3
MEPLLRSLRERFPGAELVLLLSHVFAGLLESQGYQSITVDKKRQIAMPWLFLGLVRRLRRRSFDVAIDASHPHSFSLSGAVSAAMCNSPCRIGTRAGKWQGWYTAVPGPPDRETHESRTIHDLGSVWNDWPGWTPPRLTVPGAGSRDSIGMHVGGRPGKAYPLERLSILVRELASVAPLELYWGSEEERSVAESVASEGVTVIPRMDVAGFMHQVAGLRAFVSPDTGPMHLASALGVPVVALFRTDNASRFAPLSERSRVLQDPDGAPPGEVTTAVRSILG